MPKWVLIVPKWTKEAVKKKLKKGKLTTKKPVVINKSKETPKKPWVIKAKSKMQMIKERIDRKNGIKPKDSGKALTKAPVKKPAVRKLAKVDKKKKLV